RGARVAQEVLPALLSAHPRIEAVADAPLLVHDGGEVLGGHHRASEHLVRVGGLDILVGMHPAGAHDLAPAVAHPACRAQAHEGERIILAGGTSAPRWASSVRMRSSR